MSEADGQRQDYVVDASVAIKLVVIEPLSDGAAAFFRSASARPAAQLYVPDLFFGECANILWKYVRRQGLSLATARWALTRLQALGLRSIATVELVDEALLIAATYAITAYDACYAALAGRLALPLVTADEALVRKLAQSPYDVRALGDLTIPPPP